MAVPTCNGGRHLREALAGIFRCDTPHELLIVDDRSEDDTLTIAREIVGDAGRILVNGERLGLAGNWNRCVALSRSPVVAIFHQDDVMLPGHLATHLAAHRQNPALGWVASAATMIDERGRALPEAAVERGGLGEQDRDFTDGIGGAGFAGGFGMPELTYRNPLRCSAVTIRREAHAHVGGFDPSYRYVVDWDFWLRVANVRPVAWRGQTTVAVRWHPASETHRFAAGMADLDETTRLLRLMNELVSQAFKEVNRWPLRAERRLARAYLNRAHVAFRQGDPALARRALHRAMVIAPDRTLGQLALDPRLLAQMAAVFLASGLVRHRHRARFAAGTRAGDGGGRLPDSRDGAIMKGPT